jgi:hypothetical protein
MWNSEGDAMQYFPLIVTEQDKMVVEMIRQFVDC